MKIFFSFLFFLQSVLLWSTACDCNPDGSATLQCNQNNGSCVCMVGIGGEKCDQCARGYIGTAPQCVPCGECFDNWDRILNDLHGKSCLT